MKKQITMAAMAAMIMVGLTACSSDDEPATIKEDIKDNPRKEITMSRADADVVKSENKFAVSLFGQMSDESADDNVAVSTYSVATALSMLANGAEGDELSDLLKELETDNVSALNDLNCKLLDELSKLDKTVKLKISNSFWFGPAFNVFDDFRNAIEGNYMATLNTADLTSQQGVDAFNDWCSSATDGMITKMLESPKEDIKMLLANATLFKGEWKYRFDEKDTKDGVFHGISGDIPAKMMSRKGGYRSIMGDNFRGARMDYGNSSFRMTILMPNEGTSLNGFIKGFTLDKWDEINRSNQAESAYQITMPRFKVESNCDELMNLLSQKMPNAFGINNIYKKIGASDIGKGMKVTSVMHSAVIEVEEAGTKAASVTVIGGVDGAIPGFGSDPNLVIDRPFVFVIDEASTGAILFMGAVKTL